MAMEDNGAAESRSPEVPRKLVEAQLERLLADSRFVRSERLSRFLRYAVEKTLAGKGEELKEYLIALEVYGRPASYDPSVDSLVRVEASRLRNKLLNYYQTNGSHDPIRIDFVKGKYEPVFVDQELSRKLPAEPTYNSISDTSEGVPILADQPPPAPAVHRRRLVWTALLIGVAVLASWLTKIIHSKDQLGAAPSSSIAVLPFANFTMDSEAEAFAAGLTEDITSALSRASQWRVAARTSTLPFQTKPDNVISIGRQLHVGLVLEGSVSKEGGRLRITAQLVSTDDGYHLWTETYDRESRPRLEVQAQVAQSIAKSISNQRGRWERKVTARDSAAREAREISRRAQQVIDRGAQDHLLTSRPDEDGRRLLSEIMAAIQDFERAITLDPQYTPAYGGLAEAYSVASDFDEHLAGKAREVALRGLQVDDNLAAAHFILGYGKFLRKWDFAGAGQELKRTVELNPRHVTACRLYADCSALLGDSSSGFAALHRAEQLMPHSPVIAIQVGIMLYHARRFDEMAVYARNLQRQHPNVPLVYWLQGLALEQQGKYTEAAAAFERCLQLSPQNVRATPALGHLYGLLGRRTDALRLIETSRNRAIKGSPGPSGIALMYMGLGDREAAFAWLETAFERREGALPYIKIDPRFDPIRTDARFTALLRKLGL